MYCFLKTRWFLLWLCSRLFTDILVLFSWSWCKIASFGILEDSFVRNEQWLEVASYENGSPWEVKALENWCFVHPVLFCLLWQATFQEVEFLESKTPRVDKMSCWPKIDMWQSQIQTVVLNSSYLGLHKICCFFLYKFWN